MPSRKKRPYTKPRKPKTSTTAIKNIVKQELNKTVEKKRINTVYSIVDYPMGQVNGNNNGYYSDDITPQMIPGTAVNQRIGNEIKITSLHMQLQLRQMSAATSPVKMVFYMIQSKGFYTGLSSQIVSQLFNTNNYIGAGTTIYDSGSDMNVDQFANFRVVKKFTVYMKPDGFSGQQMPMLRHVGLKFKTPLLVRWYSANQADFSQGRLFLIGFSSNGNASTATASTTSNVPVTAINTGQLINYNIKWYYTDD